MIYQINLTIDVDETGKILGVGRKRLPFKVYPALVDEAIDKAMSDILHHENGED